MSDNDERSQPFPPSATQETAFSSRSPFQPASGSGGRLAGTATASGPTQQPASSPRPPAQPVAHFAQPVAVAAAPASRASGGGRAPVVAHAAAIPTSGPANARPAVSITGPGPAAAQPGGTISASGPATAQPGGAIGASGPTPTQSSVANAAVDAAVATACAATLSAFREGKLSRADAIAQFAKHVARGKGRPEDITPWVDAICQHFVSTVIARSAGAFRLPAVSSAQPAPAPVAAPSQPPAGPAPAPPSQHVRAAASAHSRASSPGSSDEDNELGPGDDSPGRSRKRPAYDPDAAPFHSADARLSARPISTHVARTLAIRANYCADLRAAKQDVLRDGLAPALPEDLWDAILANRVVDFDKILSARSAPQISERHSQQIGDADAYIVLGAARAVRKVSNRSQWQECWNVYEEAVLYAYPHRKYELKNYGRLVNDLFDSIHDSHHAAVLRGDIAMRSDVASNRTWSFFDEDKLTRSHMRHTQPWGSAVVAASPDQSKSARRPKLTRVEGNSGEFCNNFNDRACKYDKCRHLHMCRICLRKDHGARDHLDAVRKEAEAGTRARIASRAAGGGGSPS